MDIEFGHSVVDVLAGISVERLSRSEQTHEIMDTCDENRLVVVLAGLGVWFDCLIHQLAHRLLELAMRVGEVRRVVGLREPRLRVEGGKSARASAAAPVKGSIDTAG